MGFDRQLAHEMAEGMKHRIIDDVLTHSGKGVHPRIFLTKEDFERIRTSDDEVYAIGRRYVFERADKYMSAPLLYYNIPDGIRLLQVSRDTLARSFYLGMAYRLSGEGKYAERLWLELENAAGYKDWNPYHHLDVGEMCNAFGFGYDWIYDYLTEDRRRVLRDAIVKNGFNATMDDYLDRERKRSYRWYQDDPGDNWVFVCNGGATVAALAICDEPGVDRELLEDIFGFAFERTYRAVRDMYLPDGSYSEGFTYWNYASDYLGFYLAALFSAAGTDYGLADYEPVHKSAYYVKMMCSNTFKSFNFGDAIETFMCPEVMMWIGARYGDPRITTMRRQVITRGLHVASAYDLVWYRPCEEASLEGLPLGFGSVGGDNAAVRAGFGEGDLYGAIHFGENDAYHGHADTGNFVIEWKGRRFLCDLGQDNYNVKNYRNAYRYRAEGHNTLVINPADAPDQNIRAITKIDRFSDGEDGEAYAIADMSDVYFGKGVKRGLKMTADKKWIVVRDELKLDKTDTGFWFAHTKGKITVAPDGRSAEIEMDGEKLLAYIIGGDGSFSVMPCVHLFEGHVQKDQRDNSEFSKLAIAFDGAQTALAVAFTPFEGEMPSTLPENTALSEW